MHVRKEIGPVFQPDVVQFADSLPKTRNGKIYKLVEGPLFYFLIFFYINIYPKAFT